jgi:hypothetical protein
VTIETWRGGERIAVHPRALHRGESYQLREKKQAGLFGGSLIRPERLAEEGGSD